MGPWPQQKGWGGNNWGKKTDNFGGCKSSAKKQQPPQLPTPPPPPHIFPRVLTFSSAVTSLNGGLDPIGSQRVGDDRGRNMVPPRNIAPPRGGGCKFQFGVCSSGVSKLGGGVDHQTNIRSYTWCHPFWQTVDRFGSTFIYLSVFFYLYLSIYLCISVFTDTVNTAGTVNTTGTVKCWNGVACGCVWGYAEKAFTGA